MGKPLSRPDCLRQNPRCLGKGDEEEAYIEDCYVPQRSIYDTMRINEQIDQGTKLCQQSRSTLGSTGEARGEGSTLSSNGTIGTELGNVFVSRNTEHASGVKKLDERVIFDALKLTGDPQIMSPPVGIVGPGLPITPSSSTGVVAAVAKRRLQGSDKKDNPNRRSWKAFMPPSYPEFAERLEFSCEAERRQSGPGIPLSALQVVPLTPTSSTPSIPPHTPSPLSSVPHTPPVSSPSVTPTVSPVPPLLQPVKPKPVHPMLQKQNKHPIIVLPSSPKESPKKTLRGVSDAPPQQSPSASRPVHRRTTSSTKPQIIQIPEEPAESIKTSDSERDSPFLEHDQADNAPLIPPKPVFCPPTKARTWPRSITTGKRTQVGLRHNFPVLPPLPPFIREDNNTDEESIYLLDPPSPFLKEEDGIVYSGLPMSPYASHEGLDEGLLGWDMGQLRERTASELKFEEDERRILAELEEEEKQNEACGILTENDDLAQREEREWEAVLKLENKDIIDQCWDKEALESEEWDLTGSSGHWPLLTPPTGFGGPGGANASPCPSSGAESDDLFLQLERQCEGEEEDYEEGVEMCVDPEPIDPYDISCVDEQDTADFEGTSPLDEVDDEVERITNNMDSNEPIDESVEDFDLKRTQDCENEHSIIDEYEDEFETSNVEEDDILSYPTDSALGQQLESDSPPDRTDGIKMESDMGDKIAQPETDLDSGASSEHGDAENIKDQVVFDGISRSPLNPYDDKQEQDTKQEVIEWDVCDQSEPSLESSEGLLTDQSHEFLEKENDTQCATPEVDIQTSSEMVFMETHDTEATSCAPETLDAPSEPNTDEATASISKPSSVKKPLSADLVSQSSPLSNSEGAGVDPKDSFEAFVVSDSFVYLAVSVPPQSPHECPPSPLHEHSVPPSPIPKPSHGSEEQDGALLSPDSFVYMAAPERPQLGPSDVGSACEDVPDQDLDSFSEGTHSGVDFVLGSMEGDSDWESEGSTLDFPLFNTDPVWDNIEPGLLYSLFYESNQTPALTPQEDVESQKEDTPCFTDPLPESGQSSPMGHESPDTLPHPEADTASEVCY